MRTLHIPRYTVKDYNLWEGEWELIDGIPYAMSPSPVFRHQRFSLRTAIALENALTNEKNKCGDCTVVTDLDWILNEETLLRPDIAIVCHKIEDFITQPPVLIIEILSPSTALKDRHTKFEIYQEQGVAYYIIADANAKTHKTYMLVDGQYQEKDIKQFLLHGDCTITLDVAQMMTEV